MTTNNVLTVTNSDADRVAVKLGFSGTLSLSSAEIRSLLKRLRDCEAAPNITVDFGLGHAATANSVRFGALDDRIAREELISTANAAWVGADARVRAVPDSVPVASDLSEAERHEFFTSLKKD